MFNFFFILFIQPLPLRGPCFRRAETIFRDRKICFYTAKFKRAVPYIIGPRIKFRIYTSQLISLTLRSSLLSGSSRRKKLKKEGKEKREEESSLFFYFPFFLFSDSLATRRSCSVATYLGQTTGSDQFGYFAKKNVARFTLFTVHPVG